MAKSELFWFPLSAIASGAGAFKVNRGQADYAAIETAVRLAREGNVIAMFPEGTRRRKGLRKTRDSRRAHRRRADRARGRRSARPGGDQGHRRPAPPRAVAGAVRRADRPRGSAWTGDRRGGPHRDRPADGGDPGARGIAVSGLLLAIDGDSLAHRAYHALPKSIRLNALVGFAGFLQRLWESEQPEAGARRLGLARHAHLPARGSAGLPVGPHLRGLDPGAARPPARARRVVRVQGGEGAGLRGRRLPRRLGAGVARARCSSRPPTATRSSSSPTGSRSCSRSRVSPSWRGSARPRCASATASSRPRCRTSSRCAVTPRTRSRARPASGRRRPPTC